MKQYSFTKITLIATTFLIVAGLISCSKNEASVKDVMDRVVTELYQTKSESELSGLDYNQSMSLFSEQDLQVLSTRHWMFDVNVPVVVSVIRSTEQKTVPFWLIASGFKKTEMTMNNEHVTYEVWQKSFKKGTVGLGINGVENYSLHYFVSIAPQNKSKELKLSNFFPESQYVGILDDNAFIYHDWTELVVLNVPQILKGQKLLTTFRGRGVETHLVGAFRTTTHLSSNVPDQIMLTWSSDPSTSMDIQWRTDTTVSSGVVKYREKGNAEESTISAEVYRMEDRVLMNDRYIHRYTAKLRDLKPGTTYEYQIAPQAGWSENQTFATAENDDSFSFTWFGDTHYSPKFGLLFNKADAAHPDVAFYSIAGDMVSDGLYRNQWDDLFEFPKTIISRKPFMNVLGNHDNRSGLGALMYRELFSYPKNGPDGIDPEHTYSFTYKNALFLMIDATSSTEEQTQWIEDELDKTNATWKFAMFHFPPYNWEEPYFDIQKEWVPLFDKYHVDMVFSGHIHYYMRSRPMNGGEVVQSYNDGTAYAISIAVPSRTRDILDEPYAEVRNTDGQFYQYLKIDGYELVYKSIDSEGNLADSFKIEK
jgi:acid phosphatase type 7